jgi:hypothetical protein
MMVLHVMISALSAWQSAVVMARGHMTMTLSRFFPSVLETPKLEIATASNSKTTEQPAATM